MGRQKSAGSWKCWELQSWLMADEVSLRSHVNARGCAWLWWWGGAAATSLPCDVGHDSASDTSCATCWLAAAECSLCTDCTLGWGKPPADVSNRVLAWPRIHQSVARRCSSVQINHPVPFICINAPVASFILPDSPERGWPRAACMQLAWAAPAYVYNCKSHPVCSP
jgi:hypothetical protein